ncbi:NADH-quinone oxidoreductase subunit NuoF [Ornatilinea apprima]|uniref:NADH-quinone oxidoreductase subunit NuoF n=1 Tax=Ornatilinea apprima TaxID=1134406 RepID=UPI0009462707|nr:NADH-quinone oxidoreductase subunit NuoF [Ornatilinea apprima]
MDNNELTIIAATELETQEKYAHRLHICAGTGCISTDSENVIKRMQELVKERGLQDTVMIKKVGCMGLCAAGPIVKVEPEGILYKTVAPEDVEDILDALGGHPVERLLIDTQLPFFARQKKNTLENSGEVNPEQIDDYIAHNGYKALVKAVTSMTREEVVEEIKKSGLRGRGGAGFPTGIKWSIVAQEKGDKKYVLCNADEGDPGAFMDRSVLESDPHVILEGMAIAAYAVGANEGIVYVRAEYPLAVKRLRMAIRQAERKGLLGENICGTGFNFTLDMRLGAGAFVCGEETALISSAEGDRGVPRTRPPFPAVKGLFGKPTLINNVETFANVPSIILKGGEWFSSIGTEKSKGTKVFALTGKIANTGLIEVPMGITLREIVYEIGGGIPGGHKFKAIQTGGPSGGCIPEECLDTAVDYESLKELGSMMGSGGMIVIDDTSNMIDMAKYFVEFSMEESCGKCPPCRIGMRRIYDMLSKFSKGEAEEKDIAELEQMCHMVISASLCGLGKSAPNPVLSTLRYFRHEYEEKIKKPGIVGDTTEKTPAGTPVHVAG